MTNQSPESVIAEVIEYHADTIGSHYDGCHKHHAVCLAVKLRDMLREPGVPDAATEERVKKIILESLVFTNENSEPWAQLLTENILAALDGAPEPEWEWAVRAPGDDEPFSDVYQTREHLAEQETGIAWGEEQLIRRRKAGPWLPVEGESK